MKRKQAIIDDWGEDSTVGIYIYDDADDTLDPLSWPSDWPLRVSPAFLEDRGFEVVYA